MGWLKNVLLCMGIIFLSGCAGMPAGITTVMPAADRLLGMVLNKAFAPDLKPVEAGYSGFFQDLETELEHNCKNGDCRSAHFGWVNKEVSANFEVECVPKNGLMSCDHFKQTIGDTKVYPAGASVFEFQQNGKPKMLAYELRGNGKTDTVSILLGKGESSIQESVREEPPKVLPLASIAPPRESVVVIPQPLVPERKIAVVPPVPAHVYSRKKESPKAAPSAIVDTGKIIRADLVVKKTPISKKNKKINTKKSKAKYKPIPNPRVV